jgi:serine/threonine protein kinase
MDNLSPRHSYEAPPEPRAAIGRYNIERQLGRGGMGEVLKGFDPVSLKHVAIKILDAEAYRDDEILRRFEREAQSALTLDHPNVARFFGMEYDEENRPFLVMEFIDGHPLDKWMKNNLDAPFSRIVDFAIQAARGLENAYHRSIIHRDIKPSNLIITPELNLKIIDFGLAKSLWDTSTITSTGMVVGTPRYISPEQGMGRSVDHRSDIYSLGATLYELLTRQPPYDGDTPLAIMMKHINTPLVPPYLVNPKIPGDVNEIVLKMMAKDPKERYQDYEPLIRDMESAKIHRLSKERRSAEMEHFAGNAATVMVDGSNNNDGATTPASRPASYLSEGLVNVSYTGPEEQPRSRASMVILSVAGLILVVLALAALFVPRNHEGEKSSNPISRKFASWMKKDKGTDKPAGTSPEERAREDADKIRQTQSRMEAVVSKVLQGQAVAPEKQVTIRELRNSGGMSDEDTMDAWGHDLTIVHSGDGAGVLVSSGRDGEENTDDDVRYPLDGTGKTVPKALRAEDMEPEKTNAGTK